MTDKNNPKEGAVKISRYLILLGLIAPAGYLIGFSYYQGTLAAYGVITDNFPVSTTDMYITSYYAVGFLLAEMAMFAAMLFNAIQTSPGIYWASFVFLLVFSFAYIFINRARLLKEERFNRNLNKATKFLLYLHISNNDFTKSLSVAGLTSYGFLVILLLLMAFFLSWVTLPAAAYYKGHAVAQNNINEYLDKGCFVPKNKNWSNCKILKSHDGSVLYKGLLVTYANDIVAFFTKEGSFIFKMPEGAILVTEWTGDKVSPHTTQ